MTKKYSLHFSLFEKSDALVQMDSSTDRYKWAIPVSQTCLLYTSRAKVIEAEAEVPKAMAEAFRNGNLGIMDYYRMKNIEADTSMRS